jgi:hypothetical protein
MRSGGGINQIASLKTSAGSLSESPFQKSAIVKAVNHLSIERIERYTLHELSDLEIHQVEEHIAGCPECEDRLQDEIESPAAMRSSTVGGVRRMLEAGRKKPARR